VTVARYHIEIYSAVGVHEELAECNVLAKERVTVVLVLDPESNCVVETAAGNGLTGPLLELGVE
jgi:hypothetical protein